MELCAVCVHSSHECHYTLAIATPVAHTYPVGIDAWYLMIAPAKGTLSAQPWRRGSPPLPWAESCRRNLDHSGIGFQALIISGMHNDSGWGGVGGALHELAGRCWGLVMN